MSSGVAVSGDGYWVETGRDYPGSVADGYLLDNGSRLVLTLALGEHRYRADLASDGGEQFAGTWTHPGGLTGTAGGALYRSLDGYFFFGRWAEGGKDHHWWFHLRTGEAVGDEAD